MLESGSAVSEEQETGIQAVLARFSSAWGLRNYLESDMVETHSMAMSILGLYLMGQRLHATSCWGRLRDSPLYCKTTKLFHRSISSTTNQAPESTYSLAGNSIAALAASLLGDDPTAAGILTAFAGLSGIRHSNGFLYGAWDSVKRESSAPPFLHSNLWFCLAARQSGISMWQDILKGVQFIPFDVEGWKGVPSVDAESGRTMVFSDDMALLYALMCSVGRVQEAKQIGNLMLGYPFYMGRYFVRGFDVDEKRVAPAMSSYKNALCSLSLPASPHTQAAMASVVNSLCSPSGVLFASSTTAPRISLDSSLLCLAAIQRPGALLDFVGAGHA